MWSALRVRCVSFGIIHFDHLNDSHTYWRWPVYTASHRIGWMKGAKHQVEMLPDRIQWRLLLFSLVYASLLRLFFFLLLFFGILSAVGWFHMSFALHIPLSLRNSIYSGRQVNDNRTQKKWRPSRKITFGFNVSSPNVDKCIIEYNFRWRMCQSLAEVTTMETHSHIRTHTRHDFISHCI